MKLVLVGLPTRDAAAAEVFVRKQLRGWDCVSVPAPRGGALPPADLYLIDLAGSALSRWSEEGEAVVRAWLQRAPAVLVVPAFDTSWTVLDRSQGLACVLVTKPYRTDDLRDAIDQAARLKPAAAPVEPRPEAPRVAPVQPAAPVVSVVPAPAVAVVPSPAKARPPVSTGLGIAAFAHGVASAPVSAGHHRFLHRLVEALEAAEPFEVRFTVQNSLIVHPQETWVASNTPMGVILRVCASDALSSVVSIRALAEDEAQMRAHRLGMPIAPLGPFLADLAAAAVPPPGAASAAA